MTRWMSERDELAMKLHSTTDAWVWTQEFCARFSLYAEDGVIQDPHGLMVGWFANAIETGRSAAEAERDQARAETDRVLSELATCAVQRDQARAEVERLRTRLNDLVVIDDVWTRHRAECNDDPCDACRVMGKVELEAYELARAALGSSGEVGTEQETR